MRKPDFKFNILLAICLLIPMIAQAQISTRIDLTLKEKTLKEFFQAVESKTDFTFMYNNIDLNRKVSIDVKQTSLESILKSVLSPNSLTYEVRNKQILVKEVSFVNPSSDGNTIRISGLVVDTRGEPVIGANVVEKGTTNGTITNIDGRFSLTVKAGSMIVVTYIGFAEKQISSSDRNISRIVLEENSELLDEVVVVGYGSQKKVNLTGAVSTVKINDQFASRSIASTSTALNGMVPGLMVQQGTGMAGKDGSTLRIRGLGTVNNTDPLVVVDGMPDVDLNRIDMNDIETISVLKDASASAVYGSRAANGVILITTKKGKDGSVNINYSGNFSYGNPTGKYDYLADYPRALTLHNEAAKNSGAALMYKDGTIDEWLARGMVDPILYPNTDWYDVIFRSPFTHNHSLSASGGTDKGSFYISANLLDQEGVLITNDFKRYSFRSNVEHKIRKNIKVGANLVGQWSDQSYPMEDGLVGYSDTFNFDGLARSVSGILPQHPVTGEYGGAMAYGEDSFAYNMLSYVSSAKNKTVRKDFNGLGFLEWQPIDWLQFRMDYGLTYRTDFVKSYNMPTTWQNFQTGMPGLVYIAQSAGVNDTTKEWYKTLWNTHMIFDKEIVRGHHLRFQGIYSEEYWNYRYQSSSRTKRWHPDLHEVNAADTETQGAGGTSEAEGLRSTVAKLNYEMFDKYLLQVLVRWDGSSKFVKGHQWGTFPSVSAGWRFSEEDFFEPVKKIISSGKLRASWGEVGNNSGVKRYDQKDTYKATPYNFGNALSSGYSSTKIIDPNFTWESTKVTNLGLELGFLDNRMRAEVEVYKKLTVDMIRPGQISEFLKGYSAPNLNIGELENKGLEMTVSWQDAIQDFQYGAVANYAYNKNKLLKWNQRLGRGNTFLDYPYNMIYTYVSKGIIQTWDEVDNAPYQSDYLSPGDLLMEDINGDGFIDGNDMVAIPRYNRRLPSHDFSLSLNAAWKGFDLLVFLQGSAGRKDFWRDDFNRVDIAATRYAFLEHHRDAWSLENRSASLPRLTSGNNGGYRHDNSTYWLYSCNYLRMKNMQVGYNVPRIVLQHLGVNSLRLYVSADNLFTITNWPGLDPEKIPTYKDATNPYPLVRTFSFGINLSL